MAYEYDCKNIEDLNHDLNNPRLPKSLHSKNIKDIYEYMIMQADVISLIEAMGKNGFFPGEPIIVVEEEGTYKVIEGNRRLTAVKLINDPSLALQLTDRIKEITDNISIEVKKSLLKIPCLIAKDNDDIKVADQFLGYRHITGTKSWKSLEKARYLNKMYNQLKNEDKNKDDENIYKELAKLIGSKSDYIRRILIAFDVYMKIEEKKFFQINNNNLNDNNFHFVNLADSIVKTNISSYLGVNLKSDKPLSHLNISHIENWTRWLFEKENGMKTRITGTSSQLSDLDIILSNEDAKEKFINENYSLSDAKEFTNQKAELINNLILRSKKNLEAVLVKLHSIETFNPTLKGQLKEINELCRSINDLNIKRNSEKSEDEFGL